MGRASSITALPDDIRRWLERALTEQGFAGYEALEAMMRDKGYAISKSAIHRYGQKIERKFEKIKAATEAARIITEGAADTADDRSAAVLAMVQAETFEIMLRLSELEDAEDPAARLKILSGVGRSMADLTRASLSLKKHQREIQARASEVAEKAAKMAAKGGLSEESVAEIRRSILGIAA
jgi:hypothetical protein